ncbi:MAG: hypothetical protein IJ538_03730 [Clostridia bacterium]|nr:hypothetical protein [Clostridia bacterium]
MRKRPICLYWILSLISIVSFIALIVLVLYLYKYKSDSTLLGIFSAWISIIAGLTFSALISLFVQVINDNANKKDILERKELIRKRELDILSRELSPFLSFYYYNEKFLLDKYKIKDSMLNNNLDTNIIHSNMQILNKHLKRANKQNKAFIENYLLLSQATQEQYNKIVDVICKKGVEFENINIDFNFEIFSKEEIETLKIIPLYIKEYNDNVYLSLDNFIKIVKTFNLTINFNDYIWTVLLAIMISDSN